MGETSKPAIREPGKFSTTIKQVCWDMKMDDHKESGHFWEYKETSPHWVRIARLPVPCDGVFLIGSRSVRVRIIEIEKFSAGHIPTKYANGLIKTKYCWALKCILVNPAPVALSESEKE